MSTALPDAPKASSRRKIRFDQTIDVVNVDSPTEDERPSVWYTTGDCRSFRADYVRESLENTTVRRVDFARSQRIDAVRDLLLRAQDVQRKQLKLKAYLNIGVGNDIQWGSYSRWLADFYKHHNEACVVSARSRGIENSSSTANQRWSVPNPAEQQHVQSTKILPLHYDPSRAVATAAKILEHTLQSPGSQRLAISLTNSRSCEDFSFYESPTETTKPKKQLSPALDSVNPLEPKQERWSAGSCHGPSPPCRRRLSNDYQGHEHVPPIENADKPIRRGRRGKANRNSDLNSRWMAHSTHGPSPTSRYSKTKNRNGVDRSANKPKDLPLKPLRHIITPPLLYVPHI